MANQEIKPKLTTLERLASVLYWHKYLCKFYESTSFALNSKSLIINPMRLV